MVVGLRMSCLRSLLVIFSMMLVVTPAYAQSLSAVPETIDVPEGHQLIEIPAEYKTVKKPIQQPTIERFDVVPGIYKIIIENGVRRREIVSPPVRGERLNLGPVQIETIRVIIYPKSYVLKDATGQTVKRFRWIKGKLTEV